MAAIGGYLSGCTQKRCYTVRCFRWLLSGGGPQEEDDTFNIGGFAHVGHRAVLDPRERGDMWLPPSIVETIFYLKFPIHAELHAVSKYMRCLLASVRHLRCSDEEDAETNYSSVVRFSMKL